MNESSVAEQTIPSGQSQTRRRDDVSPAKSRSPATKTKIVVNLPSTDTAINGPTGNGTPKTEVRRLADRPDVPGGSGTPDTGRTPLIQTDPCGEPESVGNAKRLQRASDVQHSGGVGGVKVRRKDGRKDGWKDGWKDGRKHAKGAALHKRKRNRRSRALVRQETEYPLKDFDSVDSLVTIDSAQLDPPQPTSGDTWRSDGQTGFLPKLNLGSALANVKEDDSENDNTEPPPEGTDHRPATSLPSINKLHPTRQKPAVRRRHHRNGTKDDPQPTETDSAAESKPEVPRRPEARKEEVDLGGRKILVDANSLSLSTVIRFRDPPKSQPLTLAFEYPKNYLTHRYVLDMVKNQIHSVPYGYVTALQFQDCNVRKSAEGLLNRWLVTVSCPEARDQLLRMGIKLFNQKTHLRRYDDILNEEFKEFNAWIRSVKKVLACSDDDLKLPSARGQRGNDDKQEPAR